MTERYCPLCGNEKVTGDQPCAKCRAVVEGPLAGAYKHWLEAGEMYRMCCGGLATDKTHLHFHGKYFDDHYPKVTRGPRKGQEPKRGPTVAVEHGIDFYAEGAETYYIIDTDSRVDSTHYGKAVPYSNKEFWPSLAENFDHAAEAAFNDGWLTCRSCGYHYTTEWGGCGCKSKGQEQ